MRLGLLSLAVVWLAGCGAGSSQIGGTGSGGSGGSGSSGTGGGTSASGGGGSASGGGGSASQCVDLDGDGVSNCLGDCDDQNPNVKPNATEVKNGVDDNCDGKVDNNIPGEDQDKDGTPFPADCNDAEPLVGPNAIEDTTNKVDDNCNGQVDEAPVDCEASAATSSPVGGDFAKAIGMCSPVASSLPLGGATQRGVRTKFGSSFTPRAGTKMIMLSSGVATDQVETPSYHPQGGTQFLTSVAHPLYSPPRCAAPATTPPAIDAAEFQVQLKVPQNAKNLSFNFAFFSAEYPEWVCTEYNDRFMAILESDGLDVAQLPKGQCKTGTARPTCNVSYDDKGQPVSINNAFFDICDSASGGTGSSAWTNTCTKSPTMLNGTGYQESLYDNNDPSLAKHRAGGATGWLSTTAPVKPNETITLRFIVIDEGDAKLDSAVLIDNFKWGVTAVQAPVTVDPGIN